MTPDLRLPTKTAYCQLNTDPKLKTKKLFNGLGTKGVIHAPHFSKVFVDFLIDDAPLPEEVNITRFKKRFEKFFSL